MKPELPEDVAADIEIAHVALTVRLPPDLVTAMDTYTADAKGHPDRGVLMLRIVRDWLITNGYLRSDPLDALHGGKGPSAAG